MNIPISPILVVIGTALTIIWDKIENKKIKASVLSIGLILILVGIYLPIPESTRLAKDVADTKSLSENLMGILGEHSGVPTETRSEILAAKEKYELGSIDAVDLDAMAARWSTRKAQTDLKNEQEFRTLINLQAENYTKLSNISRQTIATLQERLTKTGKQLGLKISSNYDGIPSFEEFSATYSRENAYGEWRKEFCSITVSGKTALVLYCSIVAPPSWGSYQRAIANLRIETSDRNSRLWITEFENEIVTVVSANQSYQLETSHPITNRLVAINSAVEEFMGSHAGRLRSLLVEN
jgi:hypothetical protein